MIGPLGRLPLDEFTKDIIQAWINQMRDKQHGKKVLRPFGELLALPAALP